MKNTFDDKAWADCYRENMDFLKKQYDDARYDGFDNHTVTARALGAIAAYFDVSPLSEYVSEMIRGYESEKRRLVKRPGPPPPRNRPLRRVK